jgi:hypothetical protein
MASEEEPSASKASAPGDLLKYMARHVVAYSWMDRLESEVGQLNPPSAQGFVQSGFLVHMGGAYFLATAGHIIEHLEKRLAEHRRVIDRSLLIDQWHIDRDRFAPIPFTLDSLLSTSSIVKVFDDDAGLDYALIPIRPILATNLLNAGVQPVPDDAWKNVPNDTTIQLLFGFLAEDNLATVVQTQTGPQLNLSMTMSVFNLEAVPMDEVPDCSQKPFRRFHARLHFARDMRGNSIKPIKSAVGTSGGPVFGFRREKDGTWLYWILGIQSGCSEPSNIISACPVEVFFAAVARALEQRRQERGVGEQTR